VPSSACRRPRSSPALSEGHVRVLVQRLTYLVGESDLVDRLAGARVQLSSRSSSSPAPCPPTSRRSSPKSVSPGRRHAHCERCNAASATWTAPQFARHALRVASALRPMLNLPEAVITVRSFATSRARIQTTDEEVYWRAGQDYCAAATSRRRSTSTSTLSATGSEGRILSASSRPSQRPRRRRSVSMPRATSRATDASAMSPWHSALALRYVSTRVRGRTRNPFIASRPCARPSTRRFGPSSSQRPRSGRRASTSTFTRTRSSIGTCLTIPSISNSARPRAPLQNHAVRRDLAAAHRDAGMAAAPGDPW
jgi:hypothetical protein